MAEEKLKLKKSYIIGNLQVDLIKVRKSYNIYMNKEDDELFIVDKETNEVLDHIVADCAQNFGYMQIK